MSFRAATMADTLALTTATQAMQQVRLSARMPLSIPKGMIGQYQFFRVDTGDSQQKLGSLVFGYRGPRHSDAKVPNEILGVFGGRFVGLNQADLLSINRQQEARFVQVSQEARDQMGLRVSLRESLKSEAQSSRWFELTPFDYQESLMTHLVQHGVYESLGVKDPTGLSYGHYALEIGALGLHGPSWSRVIDPKNRPYLAPGAWQYSDEELLKEALLKEAQGLAAK